jgi:hypothetical protein
VLSLLPGPAIARTPAPKIGPLEKKIGRKPAPLPDQLKKSSKNLFMQIIEQIFANYC